MENVNQYEKTELEFEDNVAFEFENLHNCNVWFAGDNNPQVYISFRLLYHKNGYDAMISPSNELSDAIPSDYMKIIMKKVDKHIK